MKSVYSIDDVLGLIKKVKEQKKNYITNFFPDTSKIQLWIKLGILSFEEAEETVFLFRSNHGFINMFFISTGISILSDNLEKLLKKYHKELFIADIIGKRQLIEDIKYALINKGFFQYTSLLRMSRIAGDGNSEEDSSPDISYPDRNQGYEVYLLLQRYFDPYAEQLPLIEEINYWVDNKSLLIYSDDNKTIQGFVIFDLIGQTSYLRYWFVHPLHREKKIGSSLLRRFFLESRNTKRQLFWVIESNDNAIKRYLHYGYNCEELCDIVLINKNIRYEGKDN